MYVSRFRSDDRTEPRLGLVDGDGETVTTIETDATTLEDALATHNWADLREAAGDEQYDADEVTLLAPVERPTNLVGVGLNYAGHAAEGGFDVPEEPLFFAKSPSSITGPGSDVVKHPEVSELHYEGEFAFVVGERASRVDADEALEYVFGYTAANDVTARDMQYADLDEANPWFRSKSMDTFTPLGPWVAPTGEGVDPANAGIETRLNGEVVQSSNTDDFIFPLEEIVAYITRHVTLNPGDVVLTGTPAGIGELVPGDEVSVEIDGLGRLANPVTEP